MGQYVSASRMYGSQDELTNGMVNRNYILSKDVERAFRCVDRKIYFTEDQKTFCYYDTDWQWEHIQLSSPSMYALALENLQLQPGHKFLNINSGVGYFNTVAGLLLGTFGVNHGLEINQPVIDLALQKLNKFMSNSAAIDYYNFCKPVFIHGNACQLMAAGYYDRVYCEYSAPPSETLYIKSLIKVNGVLIMPIDGKLVKLIRKSEHMWMAHNLVTVMSNTLHTPNSNCQKVKLLTNVSSLQDLCRFSIRSLLRENLIIQSPELKIRAKTNVHDEKTNSDEMDQDSEIVSTRACPENCSCNCRDCGPPAALYLDLADSDSSSLSITYSESTTMGEYEEPIETIEYDDSSAEEDVPYEWRIEQNHHHHQLSNAAARDLRTYRFANLCTVNPLSIRMKIRIDSLPIPTPLKNFLNYFRYN